MIDLILWASTKGDMGAWGRTTPPAAPLVAADNSPAEGVMWTWWREDGKMLLPGGGTLTGVVAILRLHTSYFDADRIAGGTGEQWARSKVAKYIRDNGTQGSMASGALPYYDVGGVRIFRPADVEAWLAANGVPGHVWVGGNVH